MQIKSMIGMNTMELEISVEDLLNKRIYHLVLNAKNIPLLAAELNTAAANRDLYGALLEILTAADDFSFHSIKEQKE